jgi:hypothetical protein
VLPVCAVPRWRVLFAARARLIPAGGIPAAGRWFRGRGGASGVPAMPAALFRGGAGLVTFRAGASTAVGGAVRACLGGGLIAPPGGAHVGGVLGAAAAIGRRVGAGGLAARVLAVMAILLSVAVRWLVLAVAGGLVGTHRGWPAVVER